ncbi:hypothetical protein FisN_7Hh016 [Fistulifera solaris]|uniref:Fatty acid hydroxylase domain-containing protein n=1 Tax=Fistulifera solaris TaxID=1519565 RepID=A0A1Z5K384_FISSO|nr:hypothetical protein FisN_7Hh016 [Fistulifera solaris]|eukprot:GAX20707.1 hypothetical protein FisN_7Hh016 [Fistulifera solaris]
MEELIDGAYGGFKVAVGTIVLTFVLEMCSLPTVKSVLKQTDGPSLYLTAIWYNFRNHFLLGIPTYAVAVAFLCAPVTVQSNKNILQTTANILSVILLQNLVYYQVHKTFHSSPELYQYHRFHHRFNVHTPPSAANAVSVVEYLVAYVLPFGGIAALVGATEGEMNIAVIVLSVLNLLVHTPRLDFLPYWPACLVSPHQHLDHHRKVTVHYASPFCNVDWFIEQGAALLRPILVSGSKS